MAQNPLDIAVMEGHAHESGRRYRQNRRLSGHIAECQVVDVNPLLLWQHQLHIHPGALGPGAAGYGRRRTHTRMRPLDAGAILHGMSTDSHRIPAQPTLDGLEDKWTQRWAKERVVQV
jgi:hypothetical protein